MIDFATAERLVMRAERIYDVAYDEGCTSAIARALERVAADQGSFEDFALWTVSECRNPNPLQDIPDLKYLVGHPLEATDSGSVKRFFIATWQCMRQKVAVCPI